MKKKNKEQIISNYKILNDATKTLGALRDGVRLQDMDIHQIQVSLLDKDDDGIVFCLEYDDYTQELNKTFHTMQEYFDCESADKVIEIELEEYQEEEDETKEPLLN